MSRADGLDGKVRQEQREPPFEPSTSDIISMMQRASACLLRDWLATST